MIKTRHICSTYHLPGYVLQHFTALSTLFTFLHLNLNNTLTPRQTLLLFTADERQHECLSRIVLNQPFLSQSSKCTDSSSLCKSTLWWMTSALWMLVAGSCSSAGSPYSLPCKAVSLSRVSRVCPQTCLCQLYLAPQKRNLIKIVHKPMTYNYIKKTPFQ